MDFVHRIRDVGKKVDCCRLGEFCKAEANRRSAASQSSVMQLVRHDRGLR